MATIGETLRSARERRGLTIEQVAHETRISARFIEALEAEEFEALPAPVYVRGFLRSYANYLKLDPQPLIDQLVGGDEFSPPGPEGFVGGPRAFRPQRVQRERTDPFRKPAAPAGGTFGARSDAGDEGDGWAPELPAGDEFERSREPLEPPSYHEAANPDPYGFERGRGPYRRATGGVLVERPLPAGEGGVGRWVVLAAAAVAAVAVGVAVVALAGGGGKGDGTAPGAAEQQTPQLTPAAVVPVGSATPRATGTGTVVSSTGTPGASPTGTVTGTPSAVATGTPTGAPGPGTPTATPTTAPSPTATPTSAPTATPTPFVPTPTPTPLPPRPSTLSACNLNLEVGKCGPSPARVICFPPFPQDLGVGTNSNWFVDVSGTYPLQPGWREVYVEYSVSVGPLIEAGQTGCR